jgi:hypothetical protein
MQIDIRAKNLVGLPFFSSLQRRENLQKTHWMSLYRVSSKNPVFDRPEPPEAKKLLGPVSPTLLGASSRNPVFGFGQTEFELKPLSLEVASLLEDLKAKVRRDDFSAPETIINSVFSQLKGFIFHAKKRQADDNSQETIMNELELMSNDYKHHVLYPEESAENPDLPIEQLHLNWKKWSTCKFLAAKFGHSQAKNDLKDAIQSKADACEELFLSTSSLSSHSPNAASVPPLSSTSPKPSESDKNRVHFFRFYEDQVKFAKEYFLERHFVLCGEPFETKNVFLYESSGCCPD